MRIKIGVLGATGYTGAELLRLLVNHPGVEVSWLTSEKFAGKDISEVFPHLKGFLEIECNSVQKLKELDKVDLAFSCLPHGTSMHFVKRLLDTGARVIDFSADFRFSNAMVYEDWFKSKHKYKNYLKEAVYGLPELYKEHIMGARLIANPGCYATSVILGLAPLAAEELLKGDSVIADIKSGLSGGGRAPSLGHHFPEANESVNIDSVSGHNQKPEIEQELSNLSNTKVKVTFIPHTVPLNRGILATIYCRLNKKVSLDKVHGIYEEFYSQEKFIRLSQKEDYPCTKNVRYSNMCDIGASFQDDVFVSVVAIDNLGKGACGQAIQNMNIMFDFPETEGLMSTAIYP